LLLNAQVKEIGTPFIKNYPRKITKAGQQNWMIDQDSIGIMYFANNEGLLEFNGFDWSVQSLPNHSNVRSLKVIKDRVFVGGFNELGYFKRDLTGSMRYYSLLALLPEEQRDFGDIWKIYSIGEDIIFQSYEYIIFFNGKEFDRIIPAPSLFHFSYAVAGELYVNDLEMGMYRVAPERLDLMPGLEPLKGKEIWGMITHKEGILIATADDGLFYYKDYKLEEWKTEASDYLKKNQVFTVLRLSSGNLAFGTIQQGLLICDNTGKIIKKFNLDNGLQNNTVLSLKQDHFSNLWLGLDNGVDYMQINSPLSYFGQADGLSAGYTSANYKDKLYLGTNQGVFFKSWDALRGQEDKSAFSIIESTRGQVWSLTIIDGKLFCGHNKGFYLIENNKAKNICDRPGGWMLTQVPDNRNLMIGGTYTGFVLFEKIGNEWHYKKGIAGFDESARVFEWENKNTMWMSHGLKGIYRIQFSPKYDSIVDYRLFGEKDGLPSNFNLEINPWNHKIIISSPSGLFSFNPVDEKFYRDKEKTELFDGQFPLKLIEDKEENVWFFTDANLGVLRKQEDGNFSLITTPFTAISNNYINGFQHLNAIDAENIIFGSENGFIHYNPAISKKYDYPFQVFISQVGFLKNDSTLSDICLINSSNTSRPFKNKENHMMFYFGAGDYENINNVEFSTILEGYDENWDNWTTKRTREYTNLKRGDYTFKVRAKNGYKTIGKEASYSFHILPPWYLTWWAYFIYAILLLMAGLLVAYFIKRQTRILKRKEKFEQLRMHRQNENKIKREKLQAEKELIRVKNDQLRSEMIAKDKELANSTLQMIQKNKLLNRLKLELSKMNAKTSDELVRNHNQSLIRRINREIEDKNQWRVFEEHFEAVHEEFLKRLKEQYPDLTPREQKLASYLRLNISTKEIALLMNISARGVEVARYRLRKKFNLERDINLLDFILNF